MTMIVRAASAADIPLLEQVAAGTASRKEEGYFARCLAEKRDIFIALDGDAGAGYVMVNWQPRYAPWRRMGIPEVQDLLVRADCRGRGIGGMLVARCEALALEKGKDMIALSVGLYNAYGPAQRLYVQRGYVPDGTGITHDCEPVVPGSLKPVDDDLLLMMVKPLV